MIHPRNWNLKTCGLNCSWASKVFLTHSWKSFLWGFSLFIFFVDISYVQVHNKIIKLVKSAFGHYPAQLSPLCLLPGGQFCPLAGWQAASGIKEKQMPRNCTFLFFLLFILLSKLFTLLTANTPLTHEIFQAFCYLDSLLHLQIIPQTLVFCYTHFYRWRN